MPQMVFEYILKKNGIDPKTDLSIDQSINFGLTAAAFTSNDADYTVEFEPFATALELEGNGHVRPPWEKAPAMCPTRHIVQRKAILKKIRKSYRNSQMPSRRDWSTSIPTHPQKSQKP